ncbi:hypothetical protein ACFFMN_23375 [Planobispora siamensis]|uniref:Uncharacterized protein n=1 Tax=Planobispora siamensis TaxID=936338 RepID=A0A8J3SMT5_9ACTN|nr:hypothetical protein [Planobispora siamensis]GIH95305.1 hypothetical protein Psi01_59350 [Planobispora siamensis]
MTPRTTQQSAQASAAIDFTPGDSVHHIELSDIWGTVQAINADTDEVFVLWDMRGHGDYRPRDPRWAPAAKLSSSWL